MTKKYQIFISSTFEDLKEERRFVRDAILNIHQFPIGMEQFSAGGISQWEVIKESIDTSDYYVLLVGKRYGSLDENGISYTEREFNYAREQGVPVLAFIKADDAKYVAGQIESDRKKQKKLQAFTEKAKTGRIVKWFKEPYELQALVVTALHNEMAKGDRPGWERVEEPKITDVDETEIDLDDPFTPVDTYEFEHFQRPTDGEHREVNSEGEVIAEGLYKDEKLLSGTEFNYLIHVTSGRLIHKPDCPEDPYDATDDFTYERMEPYGWETLIPFSWSEPEITHEGLDKFYVADMVVTEKTEQMTNIRTLEEFLSEKNPKLLEHLKTLIQIENGDDN